MEKSPICFYSSCVEPLEIDGPEGAGSITKDMLPVHETRTACKNVENRKCDYTLQYWSYCRHSTLGRPNALGVFLVVVLDRAAPDGPLPGPQKMVRGLPTLNTLLQNCMPPDRRSMRLVPKRLLVRNRNAYS
jgi:hypothetical protein